MQRTNLHATALVLDGRGVFILGPSGAGKSSLALSLIDLFHMRGRFARLIADDRVWLSVEGGRLIAEAPEAIAGLAEIRGFGPARFACEPRAVLDLVVRLVKLEDAPRHREQTEETILGVVLPRLDLVEGNSAMASRAVVAWLQT